MRNGRIYGCPKAEDNATHGTGRKVKAAVARCGERDTTACPVLPITAHGREVQANDKLRKGNVNAMVNGNC